MEADQNYLPIPDGWHGSSPKSRADPQMGKAEGGGPLAGVIQKAHPERSRIRSPHPTTPKLVE